MADRYTTPLSPADEQAFQQWKAKNAPNDSGEDYDARGFFKSGGTTDERGHSTDQFKKPNHPTFSVESQYSSPGNEGGKWSEQGGKTHFTPSPANLKDRSYSDLQSYFQKYEPDAVLDPLPAQNNSGWTRVAESAPGWTRVQDQFDRTKAELEARPRMGFLDHAAELGKLAMSPITAIPGALRSVAEFVQDPGSVARQNLNPQTAGGLPGAGSVNPLTDAFGNAVAAAATIKGTPSIHEPELARLRTAGPQETPPAATPAPAKGGMGMVDAIRLVQKLRKLTPGKLADAAIDAALSHIEEIAKPKPPVVPAEALKATALPIKPKPGQPTPEMLKQAQVPLTPAEQALADHVMSGTEPQPQAAGYESIPLQGPADMPATPAAGLQQPIQPGMRLPRVPSVSPEVGPQGSDVVQGSASAVNVPSRTWTLPHAEETFKPAGATVDGRTVREHIPNQSSISASLGEDYEVLPGVREVPTSIFGEGAEAPKHPDARTAKLAAEIKKSKDLNPLIIAVDENGPYVLEGGHRFDALNMLKARSFPAQVVIDSSSIQKAIQAKFLKGKGMTQAEANALDPAGREALSREYSTFDPNPKAEPVPETPAAAAKKLSPGAQDAKALADKLNDWKFSPKEAQGMNEKAWIKLAFDSGVKLPSAAVRKNAVYNLIKKQAGPPMTAEQLFEKFRAGQKAPPEISPQGSNVAPEAVSAAEESPIPIEHEEPALVRDAVRRAVDAKMVDDSGARTLELGARRTTLSQREIDGILHEATANGSKVASGQDIANAFKTLVPDEAASLERNRISNARLEHMSEQISKEIEGFKKAKAETKARSAR